MTAETKPSFSELLATGLKIGCLSFGGPAGQVALMHRVFVADKRWIEEARFLHALNYCMLLPGPEAQQLATYVGWLLHGVKGGVAAGLTFVVPGALVVFALSWLYVTNIDLPAVSALFYGIKAAVVAIVFQSLLRVAQRALSGATDVAIAAGSFAALFLFGAPFPLVIVAAAAIGAISACPAAAEEPKGFAAGASYVTIKSAAVWAAVWTAPLALSMALLGPGHLLSKIGALFSKLAVVTFGGAYAVLAYLQQQAVEAYGWLAAGQMIDGLGLAETTPGPLILVNQFVAFVAGWQSSGGGLLMAVLASAMAAWCTFAPSFLFIFAGAPYAETLRRNRRAAGALKSITAAVLGVIANLGLWFTVHVAFAETRTIDAPWGNRIALPVLASVDAYAIAASLATGVALVRFKADLIVALALAMLLGLARVPFLAP